MRYSLRSAIIAAAAVLTTPTLALPRPATYSVVNVDGGQTPSAAPITVIQTVTESTDSETTVSVTVANSPITTTIVDGPTTIVSTYYQTVPGRTTETALIPEVSVLPDHPHHGSPPDVSLPVVTTTPMAEPEILTIISTTTATPTTEYYDNGMWHTSYAIKETSSALPAGYESSSTTSAYSSWGVTATGSLPTSSYGGGWNSTRHW
jgi:hypothetical protein